MGKNETQKRRPEEQAPHIKEENYEQPAPGDDKSAYTEEEEVLIKKRLEDLGYL